MANQPIVDFFKDAQATRYAGHGQVASQGFLGGAGAVSDAVRSFLTMELQAREVRVTKIAPLPGTDAGWKAEAELLVPDLAIKTLGTDLRQEVVERRRYSVTLDHARSVICYEPRD